MTCAERTVVSPAVGSRRGSKIRSFVETSHVSRQPALWLQQQSVVESRRHVVLQSTRSSGSTTSSPRGRSSLGSSRRQKKSKKISSSTLSSNKADSDLLSVLQIASLEELEEVYAALHASSLLSPIAKTALTQSRQSSLPSSRAALIRAIERRFRFLAANAIDTLRGHWPSYRQTLLELHRKLQISCSDRLATADLEAEIFLHLLKEHAHEVDASTLSLHDESLMSVDPEVSSVLSFQQNGRSRGSRPREWGKEGDGMASAIPNTRLASRSTGGTRSFLSRFRRFMAPLKFGSSDFVAVLQRLGASILLTKLYRSLAQHLGGRLVSRIAIYEAALQTMLIQSTGISNLSGQFQGKYALKVAQRGVDIAASRYSAARAALHVMGPALWASMLIDIACMSMGTDYSRIIRTVFCLAQIRLTRTAGWIASGEQR